MEKFNFAPAFEGEKIVFGTQRPGYPSTSVSLSEIQKWISYMKAQKIERVCCLLPRKQLKYYEVDLLEIYRKEFGENNVCHVPVKDYHLCRLNELKEKILPFLKDSDMKGKRVVVHCSGGIGRTGLVLAAWLVFKYKFSVENAIESVKNTGRNPYEAVECGNATIEEVHELLQSCQENNMS